MFHSIRYLATICTLALLPQTSLHAQTSDAKDTATIMLDKMHTISGVPGISVAVAKNGKILWQGTAGMRDTADSLPVERTTVFRFASVSKTFAATLAAKLVEEGTLDPDKPISYYRKNLPKHYQNITLRQLLSHTSGIPHYQSQDSTRGKKHYSSVTDALEVIGARPLLAEPGENYVYSTHAFTLISAVLEAAARDNYLDLVKRYITQPIGIKSIGAEDITKPQSVRTKLYAMQANGATEINPRSDFSYSWAGAGFEGTAHDLALFGSHMAAGNILKPETIDYIQELSRNNKGETVGSRNYRMGFGWRVSTDHTGRQYVHHSGAIEGGRSTVIFYPEEGLSVAILANAGWVSNVARNATILAMPFFDRNFKAANAIAASNITNGSFNDQTITAKASVNCENQEGKLNTTGVLSDYLKKYNHYSGSADTWPLACVAQLNGINYYALITPIGLISLKLDNNVLSTNGGSLSLPLNR